MNNLATQIREAVEGDKHTYYTELLLQAAELLDHKDTQINTRPAAPVEGLENSGFQSLDGETWVRLSQAEAIIAALQSDVTGSASVIEHLTQRAEKAEAANAALTARVKELEEKKEMLVWAGKEGISREEALENQLADAHKDMASVYEWLRKPDWSNRNFNLVAWANSKPSPSSFAKAYEDRERAALEDRP